MVFFSSLKILQGVPHLLKQKRKPLQLAWGHAGKKIQGKLENEINRALTESIQKITVFIEEF